MSDLQRTDEGEITLPMNHEKFKDFMVSLLGKPQTINKSFRGNFEVNKEEIKKIHSLLEARINQQNDAKMIQFRATIYYDDNSSVTLTGIDHFMDYNETQPLVSTGVHLTWQYLIKFQDKTSPEKQEITISFISDVDYRTLIDAEMPFLGNHQVNIRIQHTARTWGADIEGLISKHLEKLVTKESKIMQFLNYRTEEVANIFMILMVTLTIYFVVENTRKLGISILGKEDINVWLKHFSKMGLWILCSFLFGWALSIVLNFLGNMRKPSFILLTPESEKNKTKTLKSYKFTIFYFFGTIIGGIVINIISNYAWIFINK